MKSKVAITLYGRGWIGCGSDAYEVCEDDYGKDDGW